MRRNTFEFIIGALTVGIVSLMMLPIVMLLQSVMEPLIGLFIGMTMTGLIVKFIILKVLKEE